MQRREFIGLIGGAAAWPVAVRAQQADRIYRIGVLFAGGKAGLSIQQMAVFTKALLALGWTAGKNIQIDYRWAENDVAQIQRFVTELLSLQPDVILAHTTRVVAALQRETKTTPIVFVSVADPVASGVVASLSHPGGNVTGFSNFEPTLVGKYVEILKEIIPDMTAVSLLVTADNAISLSTQSLYEAAARYHGIALNRAPVRDDPTIERTISSLSGKPKTGLIVDGNPFFGSRHNLDLLVSLATRYRVRAVYSFRFFAEAGGLISYGNDLVDQFRQAAAYIDRLFRGANPSDLPVQAPTKYEMVINLKTAKAIGLTIPPALLVRADEVIE